MSNMPKRPCRGSPKRISSAWDAASQTEAAGDPGLPGDHCVSASRADPSRALRHATSTSRLRIANSL